MKEPGSVYITMSILKFMITISKRVYHISEVGGTMAAAKTKLKLVNKYHWLMDDHL